jgi:uncharacterized protein YkwD
MLTRRLRGVIVAAAATASLGAVVLPASAAGTAGHHKPSVAVRSYDAKLLAHSNSARAQAHAAGYTMNHKLWKVAHAWAIHLAKTGVLAHNPNLTGQISKRCPAWTAIGENVGVVYGDSVDQLFQAYMNSPEHRANILDKHYRQVGIATVKVVRDGEVEQWDVMDFGNHC